MDNADKKKTRKSGPALLNILAFIVVLYFHSTHIPGFLIWLFREYGFPQALLRISRMNPTTLRQFLLYILAILILVFSILRRLASGLNLRRPSSMLAESGHTFAGLDLPKSTDSRTNLTSQSTQSRSTRPDRPSQSYRHSTTGKQRYLDQLDEFLENGLVTKEEYKEMRKKYEEM